MKKVILVDDEKMVVESISRIVDWENYGFQLCATCLNGFQGLEAIRRYEPDVVITDIKMPVMDGIELIRRTREFNKETAFIILSGYGEFELAKQAMKEGVREYLLKPCGEEEILEALAHTCSENGEIIQEEQEADKDFVEIIIRYVEEHYGEEDLNLRWIAKELVFLNEDYVSKRFLQKTGSRFTSYLNRVRVEKAKEYLAAHSVAYNERVAAAVGFTNNPKYFAKVFKKYTGCTVKEYKEQTKSK